MIINTFQKLNQVQLLEKVTFKTTSFFLFLQSFKTLKSL
ncbi:hypothetical protein GFO_2319 [Christiangramia forsetii KT0803]|uniref:Uncharacterized protein n=1 Tax=Christiangramia forsetii (strain DSM 17595 / CGMCC 1.15422 / KT0803) TaxID=411154 RepID=A0M3T9_CHRFK|nr:hypothetical protein GFO_2319 [Christiangramia forsetii KT0803]